MKKSIRLTDHTTISSTAELVVGQLRYVLFNGRINIFKIVHFTDSLITVELNDTNKFNFITFKESIYTTLPPQNDSISHTSDS